MIAWTQKRRRCPDHGLVLRKETFYGKPEYCPACGKKLICVSAPYLFQLYFHPAVAICMVSAILLVGMFFALDVPGCNERYRLAKAVKQAAHEEWAATLVPNLPEKWQTVYLAMEEASFQWSLLKGYLNGLPQETVLPKLNADEVKLFLSIVSAGYKDDAFQLMMTRMGDDR